MMHVQQIEKLLDKGQRSEAFEALDNLLALGPTNISALKILANLYEQEGRFDEERKAWEKILQTDADDLDAIQYFHRCHLEEREYFYFTDDLLFGGKRFLAHPRMMIQASLWGLIGCTCFLMVSHFGQHFFANLHPNIILASFFILVLCPWILIAYSFIAGLREILITPEGISIVTRLKSYVLPWNEIESVALAHSDSTSKPLSLILTSKSNMSIEVNLSKFDTIIRARSYLLRDLARFFSPIHYCHRNDLKRPLGKVLSY